MFDVLYVTWFVHVTTALVWAKFWYLYLSVSPSRFCDARTLTTRPADPAVRALPPRDVCDALRVAFRSCFADCGSEGRSGEQGGTGGGDEQAAGEAQGARGEGSGQDVAVYVVGIWILRSWESWVCA